MKKIFIVLGILWFNIASSQTKLNEIKVFKGKISQTFILHKEFSFEINKIRVYFTTDDPYDKKIPCKVVDSTLKRIMFGQDDNRIFEVKVKAVYARNGTHGMKVINKSLYWKPIEIKQIK